jgi:hypothetical protein
MQPKDTYDGLVYGMPEDDFRKAPGLSFTALRNILRSPAHFKAGEAQNLDPAPLTPARAFGKLCHFLALTPGATPWFAVLPEGLDRRTKDGRAWVQTHPGKVIVDSSIYADAQLAAAALVDYPPWQAALANARAEVSWFHLLTRNAACVRLKGRIDLVCQGEALCELKFVNDARPEAVATALNTLRWDMQAAFYLDGYNRCVAAERMPARKCRFVLFAVERMEPFAVNSFVLSADILARGYKLCEAAIRRYQDCDSWQTFRAHDALCDYSVHPQYLLMEHAR